VEQQAAAARPVINRADFSLQRVIEMPAGVAFHLGNGWDDGDTVRFDACLTADDSGLRALAGVMRGENWHEAVTDSMLITLNLRNGTARSETLLRGTGSRA
jgi:carotenoid cleavage dioxygenase